MQIAACLGAGGRGWKGKKTAALARLPSVDVEQRTQSSGQQCLNRGASLVVQYLLQLIEFISEARILVELAFDFANGVKHGRVVTIAEAAANFR